MTVGMSLLKKLCTQGSRTAFRQINPLHFEFDEHERLAYDFVRIFVRQHGQLPTLEAMNDNGFPMLGFRDNEPAEYYLDRLADRFVVLKARDLLQPLQQSVSTNDAVTTLEIINNLHSTFRLTQSGGGVLSIAETIDQVVAKYNEARTRPGIQGFTLGYDWLDNMTGGIQPGDVVSMAARTGMGKSYFLNHMAMSAWLSGCSCLYVSMEMTAVQMMTRFIGQYTGITPDAIRRGQLSNWTQERFYQQTEHMKTHAPFTLVDGSFALTIDDIDNLVQEFNPDVVYIDAAYLLIPKQDRFTEKGWERQREMSKDTKRLALSRNKGVVQTLQLSSDARDKKKEKLDGGMIGGSIGVSQDATTVIIIAEGDSPNEVTTRDLMINKNREGARGWLRTNFLFEPMDFSAITSSDDEDEVVMQTMAGFTP